MSQDSIAIEDGHNKPSAHFDDEAYQSKNQLSVKNGHQSSLKQEDSKGGIYLSGYDEDSYANDSSAADLLTGHHPSVSAAAPTA